MDTALNKDMLKKEENKIDVIMETTDENLNLRFKCKTMENDSNNKTVNVKKLKESDKGLEDIYDQLHSALKVEVKERKKRQHR